MSDKYKIEVYQTASGRSPFKNFLDELTDKKDSKKEKELAQIKLAIGRLEKLGLAVNSEFPKTMKKIRNDIYELRPGNNRVLFFYFKGNTFVLLHAFRKKSQKTPLKEIDMAIQEMNDYKQRYENE